MKLTLWKNRLLHGTRPPPPLDRASADIVLPSCSVALGDRSLFGVGDVGPVETVEVKLVCVFNVLSKCGGRSLHSIPPRVRGMNLGGG